MTIKRLVRPLIDVVAEVKDHIKEDFNVTDAKLDVWIARASAQHTTHPFPKSSLIKIADISIDYEVQRDVIYEHIINIMKKWDSRVCSPVSACRIIDKGKVGKDIFAYDGQHRTIAAAILGFKEIPGAIVETGDPNFASEAFEILNDTGVRKTGPQDTHRNALVRFKNGSRELKNVRARVLQDQFDSCGVDLIDKGARKRILKTKDAVNLQKYYFSHFKYAYKGLDIDESGNRLKSILNAMLKVFPNDEEIDQGVFIGLYEINRLLGTKHNSIKMPKDWMVTLLQSLKDIFKSSGMIHQKAREQWAFSHPGAAWTAPAVMANFMRECHIATKGKLNIPYHGQGAEVGILDKTIVPGLFPKGTV